MNDRNRGGMTINALLMLSLVTSVVIPIVCLVAFGFFPSKTVYGFIPAIVASIVVLIGGLSFNYFVRRRIQDRLLSLVDVCRNFVGGDHSIRAVVSGNDEFAMLTTSLNNLLDNQNFSSNTGFSASPASGDAAALQAQIEKLLQEVSAVGDGDLRVQAEVTPDTLGVLADSFNYMIEELAKVVGRVQNTAVQVTNASRRVLDRSAELAQASETQVARISQTTHAVEALASFVQNVAHNAQLSASSAQEALQNAKMGQDSVRQSIEGMMLIRENVQETSKKIKRLGERSNEIGEIVRIIEDIADQTNLLALNAAIQSAMAGEHGRGFAVVADEIRLLAERSTESTKRIATLVKSIQGDTFEAVVAMEDSTQEVVKGSQLADEAGRALNSIYTAVERQARTIEAIAQAANEQASVSEDVANAMTEISEITSQTNAGTQEAAMSVSYLAELSDQLRASVSTFRLPERAGDSVEVFPGMSNGMAALPNGSEHDEQFYSQDMGMNGDWNQNFSSDFLSLPQPQEGENSNAFQFAFNNGQPNYANQAGFGGVPQLSSNQPGMSGQQNFGGQGFDGQQGCGGQGFGGQGFGGQGFDGQQGFGAQGFGGQGFDGQQGFGGQGFDGQSFGNYSNGFSGQQAGFDDQRGFDGQSFGGLPDSGYGNNAGFPMHSAPNQNQPAPPQNFAPSQGMQGAGQPRWQNYQQGWRNPNPNQGQAPFPGTGNGHQKQ